MPFFQCIFKTSAFLAVAEKSQEFRTGRARAVSSKTSPNRSIHCRYLYSRYIFVVHLKIFEEDSTRIQPAYNTKYLPRRDDIFHRLRKSDPESCCESSSHRLLIRIIAELSFACDTCFPRHFPDAILGREHLEVLATKDRVTSSVK